eukprot:COSAG02_NODE_124_length_35047_cov_31.554179_19_plen_67_part_00
MWYCVLQIFIEEGASGNYVIDNEVNTGSTGTGISLFSNFDEYKHGHPSWPVANNWIVGNTVIGQGL